MGSVYEAATNGSAVKLKALLDRGHDVNERNSSDWTPLHSAVAGGHVDAVRVLLNHGARIDLEAQATPQT